MLKHFSMQNTVVLVEPEITVMTLQLLAETYDKIFPHPVLLIVPGWCRSLFIPHSSSHMRITLTLFQGRVIHATSFTYRGCSPSHA